MDTQAVLDGFNPQLRGDVLVSVYDTLLECNPPFLRCSEQLRLQILTLLKPSVALKKQTVLAGRQFGSVMFLLLKGTLQVSQAPVEEERKGKGRASESSNPRQSKSLGKDEMKKQITRMNTKGFKDKLKVRPHSRPFRPRLTRSAHLLRCSRVGGECMCVRSPESSRGLDRCSHTLSRSTMGLGLRHSPSSP
jgi:hypothetical protein